MIGCNLVDPELAVRGGSDYTVEIAERSLRFLRDIGQEAVEFSHAVHWESRDVRRVRESVEGLGLVPWSLHAWFDGDALESRAAERMSHGLGRAVRNALGLGVGVIVHHPYGADLHDAPDTARARLGLEEQILAAAWRPGVRFALENSGPWAQLEYALLLAERLGPERAGICVDSGHAHVAGMGPAAVVRLAGQWVITTHLHDNDGTRDAHAPPGDGTIAWDEVAASLAEVGYDGCVMLELTDQPPPERRPTIREELARGARAARGLEERLMAWRQPPGGANSALRGR